MLAYHGNTTHEDYLARPGRQDLTAHVNFTQLEDPAREHQTIFTSTLTLNYDYDNFNPSIAVLYDINFGDAIVLPAFEYRYGDHWRLYGELSLALVKHKAAEPADTGPHVGGPPPGINNQTHLLGTFANNSQALLRITYQF